MKKTLLILSGLCLFGVFSVQAKNVLIDDASFQTAATAKLGAISDESFKPSKDYAVPEKEITDNGIPCEDPNCIKCDTKTGTCLECVKGRYLQNNLCFVCPENHYCDGKDAIPNCQGVTCADGYSSQANENGCCCVKDENTGGDNNNPSEENVCGTGQIELNGVCCEIVKATEGGYGPCPAGTTRISNGSCAKCPNADPCANVACPTGSYCSNGECLCSVGSTTTTEAQCEDPALLYGTGAVINGKECKACKSVAEVCSTKFGVGAGGSWTTYDRSQSYYHGMASFNGKNISCYSNCGAGCPSNAIGTLNRYVSEGEGEACGNVTGMGGANAVVCNATNSISYFCCMESWGYRKP